MSEDMVLGNKEEVAATENTGTETTETETQAQTDNATTEKEAAKTTTKDILGKHRNEITQEILKAMENGKAPWQNPELIEKVGLPVRNGYNKEPYTGFNALALMTKTITNDYDDPRWLSTKDIGEYNLLIKKGEKATYIEAVEYGVPNENGKAEVKSIYTIPMFNVKQLQETRELIKLTAAEPFKPKTPDIQLAEKIIKNSNVQFEHTLKGGEVPDKATYNSWTDTVSMPPKEAFNSLEGYYAEALHQVAHATGHVKRNNRKGANTNIQPNTRAGVDEQLTCEIASMFIRFETGFKLENSHAKDHQNLDAMVKMNCTKRDDTVSNSHMFAIAANNANRGLGLIKRYATMEKKQTQEQAKSAPTQEESLSQDAPEIAQKEEKVLHLDRESHAPEHFHRNGQERGSLGR
ncbi:hypothetical protein FACS1894187_19230 [Synergistales bacterium]|nr:hypothetical protein FACS1894187_19230 [Synergistales bacterium]